MTEAAGTDEPNAGAAKMRELEIGDAILENAVVREDGRVMRPFRLFEVKTETESREPCDDHKLLSEIPAEEAARPLSEGHCSLVH